MQTLGFDLELVPSVDGVWGGPLPNGSWNGFVGMLQRHDIDICTAGLAIQLRRTMVIDFATTLVRSPLGIVMKRASTVAAVNYWVYIDVFNNLVWAALAGILLVLATAFVMQQAISGVSLHSEVRT